MMNDKITDETKALRFAHPAPEATSESRRALVAWVTEADSIDPIQTTGGWLR